MTVKTEMIVTMADIRALGPCYNPNKYANDNWKGSPVKILQHPCIPAEDKLWLVLKLKCVPDRTKRLFAVWCARQALALVKSPDPCSIAAVDTAERYANGECGIEELTAAYKEGSAAAAAAADAAADAASAAAADAAAAAADAASASAAAYAAAAAAAADADADAAYAAAAAAAADADADADADAASASAAASAARQKARAAQVKQLTKMLKEQQS